MYPNSNYYIYPYSSEIPLEKQNPYIQELIYSIARNKNVLNKNAPTKHGVFDILKYLFKIDVVIFNWIENVPEKRLGVLQAFVAVFLVFFFRMRGKQVLWVMHNKKSHSTQKEWWKTRLFNFFMKKATMVLTHSSEGVRYFKKLVPARSEKIKFFHHPVHAQDFDCNEKGIPKKRDVLIWGTISPYKGVDRFLSKLIEKQCGDKYSILIIGKCTSEDYYAKLQSLAGKNTEIQNRYASFEELNQFIKESGIVLFPYLSESVLSSGALMDSLSFPTQIIGPNTGAFADLKEAGMLETFNNYDDLINTIERCLKENEKIDICAKRSKFIEENRWEMFGERLIKQIDNKIN